MTCYEKWSLGIGVFQGFAVLIVGAFAVFLPQIQRWRDKPKIELSLNNEPFGMHVLWQKSGSSRYHHVKIENRKVGTVARNLALFCVGFSQPNQNGLHEFKVTPRIRLRWPYEQKQTEAGLPNSFSAQFLRSVASEDLCDLAHVYIGAPEIQLALEAYPTQISKSIKEGPTRLYLKAIADNFESANPFVVELSWNKEWSDIDSEMAKNFIVKSVVE